MNRWSERWAVGAIIGALAAWHILAGGLTGLGDAEALYYGYSRHLDWGYLDHPPLIGWLIALATHLGPIHPATVRLVPTVCHGLTLLFGYLLALEVFGSRRAGLFAVIALALIPMMTVGGLAAAPDAPASACWMLAAWVLARELRIFREGERRSGWRELGAAGLVGLLMGLAFLSKYTGILLVPGAIAALIHPAHRTLLRGPRPWMAAAACLAAVSPVICWNATNGWVSVLHRFVWTQGGFGPSLDTVGATVGGQLLYLGVPLAVGLVWAAGRLWRERSDPGLGLPLALSAPALIFTLGLCVLSPAAEPHWPAQGYLALAVALGGLCATRSDLPRRWTAWAWAALIWLVTVLVILHLVVWTDLLPRALGPEDYEPRYDLTNELFGWPEVARAVRAERAEDEPVAGSHYTICSQLVFALDRVGEPGAVRVLCLSPEIDDFDLWGDGSARGLASVLYIEDDRFGTPAEEVFPGWERRVVDTVRLRRGALVVRTFRLVRATR